MNMKTEVRQRKATERKVRRDARTPQEQLALLDERFGPGKGAERERARLLKKIGKGK